MPHSQPAYSVVYLTGAPASGKSTLARALRARIQPLEVFEYGQRLTQYLASRHSVQLRQAELRTQSSSIASPADIAAVDTLLLDYVRQERARSHVVIDTHAVTKERYGFRITPFSLDRVAQLSPTMIIVLYTTPEVTVDRISSAPEGRPSITPWEASFHTTLQASVAATYACHLGVPAYLLDSSRSVESIVDEVSSRIERVTTSSASGLR
jgi:adenylate kinase